MGLEGFDLFAMSGDEVVKGGEGGGDFLLFFERWEWDMNGRELFPA